MICGNSHRVFPNEVYERKRRYSGDFEIIAAPGDELVVKKKYVYPCPECLRGDVCVPNKSVEKWEIEIVPVKEAAVEYSDIL